MSRPCARRPTSTSVSEPRARIALTLGDPRGIGPEIADKALAAIGDQAEWVVIGEPGAGSREPAGREVRRQVETAVRMALAGEVAGIVTGPAEKAALHAAGVSYPGHTEWLGALAGCDTAMMLVVDRLRVVLLTTHVALRAVPDLLTPERIVGIGTITRRALRAQFAIADPRLALCALNPHAGEGGAFGDEEAMMTTAAAAIGAAGPLPADTVFVRALRGEFDAVLTPVHDVGMTAVKVAGFGRGVNVTLGLPFIRTAPDHGTAMDIAGRGTADPSSLLAAMRLAVDLARRPAHG